MTLTTVPNPPRSGSGRVDRRLLPVATALLLALAWLLPNHAGPWFSFHDETIAALAGVCLVLFAIVSDRCRRNELPIAALVLLLVATIPWIQWLFGLVSYFGDALLASVYLAGVALCFWAGHCTSASDGRRLSNALAHAMLWASILSTGIALYQWFGLTGLDIWAMDGVPGARATGNLAQPNHLATLLMFGLAAAAWLHAERRIGTAVAALTGGFLALGVALTASRTPWLGLLLLGVWLARSDARRTATHAQRWLAGALLVWYGLTYWAVQSLPVPLHLLEVDLGQSRLQPGLRPLLWSQFALALKEAPWFGYGWQGGLTAQAAAALHRPGLEVSVYAHDIVFDLLIWNGVPLGALLAILLVVWYVRTAERVRTRGGWFQFAVLTFFLAHALVEYPHAYAYFLVPVALLAGQLEGQHAATTLICPRWYIAAVTAMIVAAASAVVLDYLPLADDRREVMLWQAKIGGDRPLVPPPPTLVLNQLAASARWARITPAPGMSDQQIQDQMVLARRFPSAFLLRQSALILALNGRPDAALTELHRLRGLHGDPPYRALVDELRELAVRSHPGLARLVDLIDADASRLPPLPAASVGGTATRR